MKAGNIKHAHKLPSAHENTVVLCYNLYLLDSSQSEWGGTSFSLLPLHRAINLM